MKQFYYDSISTFEESLPSQPDGITSVYYNQTSNDSKDLFNHICEMQELMAHAYDHNITDAVRLFEMQLKKHRKTGRKKKYYTGKDVVNDLYTQLSTRTRKGKFKQPTQSMINRWNNWLELVSKDWLDEFGIEMLDRLEKPSRINWNLFDCE